ncbi:hypothetical protein AJ80_05026 [Polytolypa hystricis UAMH7299]|uniref:Zn(2)-C6 fungal-type domain-containing protein n=1 Tax=Polytolypa hystricis (strain UAMH7299) TaxID=1447883 RepID=A0A2B7Y7R0_POLH7|nr:hypothetical protein AJ80_05026 [Polytolypa hystricis UAMH7299]
MAQACYGQQDELELCRRSSRGMSLPVSQAARGLGHRYLENGASQLSQTTDSDSRGSGQPTRRRIPVACERCRRRKIRCSGDLGNGEGCSNCRSSGTQNCLFLRVNSSLVHPKGTNSWPYPTMSAGPSLSTGGNQSLYDQQLSSKTNTLSAHSIATFSPSYPRNQGGYDYGTGTQSSLARLSYLQAGYEEDTASYAMSPPAYMLPSSDSSMASMYVGAQGSPRTWSPQVGKILTTMPYTGQDSHNPLGGSNYPLMAQALSHTSSSSDVPPLSASLSSLPSNLSLPDRTLPNPTSRNNITDGNTSLVPTTETTSINKFGLDLTENDRSVSHVMLESSAASTLHSTVRAASKTQNPSSSAGSGSVANSCHPEGMFEYIPASNSPPSSTLASSSVGINETTDRRDSLHISTDGSRGRSSAREHVIASGYYDYGHNKYAYSHGSQSGGSLVDGLEYTRPTPIVQMGVPSPTGFASSFPRVPVKAGNNTDSA